MPAETIDAHDLEKHLGIHDSIDAVSLFSAWSGSGSSHGSRQ
jgi:hypothetical protein